MRMRRMRATCDNFNIPPIWFWLGFFGIDGSDLSWLSAVVIAATMIVLVLLLQGRSGYHGVIALAAIISPSVMMGVERGNLDLLILALVGPAALIYQETKNRTRIGSACDSRPWRHLEANSDVLRFACGSL